MSSAREVIDSITHCPKLALFLNNGRSHPHGKIVLSQRELKEKVQLPEP
jgi:hypothetical protein